MSIILDCHQEGEQFEVKGPSGAIRYQGHGCFSIVDKIYTFNKDSLILGGTGVTPGYQIIARILEDKTDKTKLRVIDANKSEDDILLKGELEQLSKEHGNQFEIVHVLSHPGDGWGGLKGHVNEDVIKNHAFDPSACTVALLCGPPTMIQKAVLPVLQAWGYDEDKNLFSF